MTNSQQSLKSKFQGALLGTFVGDALGMPVEGWPAQAIAAEFGELRDMLDARLGKGAYTDDTQMMIALAESLVACRGLDGADLAQRFLQNFDPNRGYGRGTIQALSYLRQGVPWDRVGQRIFQGGSFGNGAAMRIAPIGLLHYDDPYQLREDAYLASQITHAQPLGKESAALQAFAVTRAVLVDPSEVLDSLAFVGDLQAFVEPEAEALVENLQKVETLLQGEPSVAEVVEILGNDVRAFVSVPAAIYAFLSHPGSFEDAVVYAVSLGGDTDTIGAMTGAIAGACHGVEAIPGHWLKSLENRDKGRDYVVDLAGKLFEIKHHHSNQP